MAIEVSAFGAFNGKRVDQFRLTSHTGIAVDIISYGGVVRDWRVPVSGGHRSVVLGFEQFDAYPAHSPHLGSLAGRIANRVKDASFDLNGKHYALPANAGTLQLHGGSEGLGRQVWDGEIDSGTNAVRLTHFSLVQHQYFNLGTGADVLDHTIQVNSSAYTELGPDHCPTGAILPSKGTQYDLRAGRTMRDAAGQPVAYDINMVLDSGRSLAEAIATVRGPDGALTLKLWSDRPGLQVYNAVSTNVAVPGLNGKQYGKHSGFCLEDQAFPDAVHNPHFPSVIYGPDRPYRHWCEFEIA